MAVECKFKTLGKPMNLIGFNNFCNDEAIQKRYVVNRNLNTTHNNSQFIQGFLVGKIKP